MTLAGLMFSAALGLAVLGAARRILLWRRGRRAPVSFLSSLLTIPKRYMHDVHDVVVRDKRAARMHIFAAGGFVACCVLIVLVHVLGIQTRVFIYALLFTSAFMAVGAVLAFLRRWRSRAARLSSGPYNILPFALAGFAGFYSLETLALTGQIPASTWATPVGLLIIAAGLFGTIFMVPGLTIGPMRHAFAGAVHLAFHPRQQRFEGKPSVALAPLDLEVDKLGTETPEDFTWRQLLSFDACVQCGRCESVCPAFAAGAPLNPKKLIFDLWEASAGDPVASDYAGSPTQEPSGPIRLTGSKEDGLIAQDTLWACTTCRACVEECPMLIEHVDAVIDIRRFETLEKGATPEKAAAVLENTAQTDTVSGKPPTARLDWASDLNLPMARTTRAFDVLLWLGDSAFELRGQQTLRALITVLRAADVDFAVLCDEELDVGDVCRRLGDEAGFQRLAKANIETLKQYQFNTIVTNDPHVLNSLKNDYPAMGGHYDVLHHTAFAERLMTENKLSLKASQSREITFHDPCYLGRYNGEFDAPRRLLEALGATITEMERSRERSFCCGWGGGAVFTDVPSQSRIPDLRMQQAKDTGACLVAAACPNCTVMLEGTPGARLDVADVIELVAEAIDQSADNQGTNERAAA
ncbi:MAG: (Fe-S)-binding protein [Pseudomonadota bacterium]